MGKLAGRLWIMARTGHERGHAIVAGGSIAGLCAGALLHRLGFSVEVFERSGEALASRGAGIVSHPQLFDVLEQAGARIDATIGVQVVGRRTFAPDGRVLGEHTLPQIMMSWDRLFRLIRERFPDRHYHAGRAIEGFEQDGGGVTVEFADGERARADWLIGADGIRSSIRRQLLPDLEPTYAGYVVWRGLIEERLISAAARTALCEHLAFCLPPGEQMLGYPVPGADEAIAPGRRRYNWAWYRPVAAEHLPALLTDADGRRYDLSIPPGRMAKGPIDEMRAAAAALVAPCFLEVVRLVEHPFIQAIYDLESPRLVLGRVALIGDAAFLARPHAGMGATKAALDALTLVEALAAADPGAALAAWERRRLRYGRALVERARWLGGYLEGPTPPPEAWAASVEGLAARLMAETAISGWLRA
jgi:2-polyprenyl-6-methoxyphenol hydroxylase-like FAD-dependent oxidoreductase